MQDIIVAVIAIGALALLVARFVRARKNPTTTCAACPTEPVVQAKKTEESAVKPLAFYGGKRDRA